MYRVVAPICRSYLMKHSALDVSVCDYGVLLLPGAKIVNPRQMREKILIREGACILGELYVMAHGGEIVVGKDTYIGEDSRIWSASRVEIGERVQISHSVNVHDTITHSLSAKLRYEHAKHTLLYGHPTTLEDVPSAPIVIEDDVWIGFGAIVLKGVKIGRGSVIGAGCVITKDVEPYSVVVGNPQRVVGKSMP